MPGVRRDGEGAGVTTIPFAPCPHCGETTGIRLVRDSDRIEAGKRRVYRVECVSRAGCGASRWFATAEAARLEWQKIKAKGQP